MIKRYWFEFSKHNANTLPLGVANGCGISAIDYEDAIVLLKEKVFADAESIPIERVIADVDISTLDTNHVIPNIGDVTVRGVWFPLGY